VTVPDGAGGTTTQARYTCDGVLNVDQPHMDNLKALLTSCRGFLVFSGGKYKLKIDKAETPVSFVLNADNIVGGWSIQLGGKRNRFNRVRARFFNQARAGSRTTRCTRTSRTARSPDASQVLEQTLDLPFTRNVYTAAQICQIEEKRSRYGTLVSLTATIAATCLEVGDVVPVNHATPGWPAAATRPRASSSAWSRPSSSPPTRCASRCWSTTRRCTASPRRRKCDGGGHLAAGPLDVATPGAPAVTRRSTRRRLGRPQEPRHVTWGTATTSSCSAAAGTSSSARPTAPALDDLPADPEPPGRTSTR
jgi:hypothetical protein